MSNLILNHACLEEEAICFSLATMASPISSAHSFAANLKRHRHSGGSTPVLFSRTIGL